MTLRSKVIYHDKAGASIARSRGPVLGTKAGISPLTSPERAIAASPWGRKRFGDPTSAEVGGNLSSRPSVASEISAFRRVVDYFGDRIASSAFRSNSLKRLRFAKVESSTKGWAGTLS